MKNEIKVRYDKIKKGICLDGCITTKIGILPVEWEKVKFNNIFTELVEYADDLDKSPLYSLTIEQGVVPKTDRYERSFLVKKEENNYKVVKPDYFVYNPMNLRFGALARSKEKVNVSVSSYYNVFRVNENYNAEFMEYYLKSRRMMYLYNSIATGSLKEKQRVHYSQFTELNLPIPSKTEQDNIAKILLKWDDSINLKEKLLQEKINCKRGLMQRLLLGELRIQGFNNKWQIIKLGKVMKERKEIGYNDLELLAITSANGVVRRTEVDIKDNSSEDKSKYKRILPGDIGYNTMRMWQGVSGLSKYEGIVSPAYTILQPTENVDSEFISYLFKLPKIINLFYRHSQGLVSDTLNLKYENFKGIKVNIPVDINEQKMIVSILRASDKEIDLLRKEIELLKEQKKGLMQLLLTGIVRV